MEHEYLQRIDDLVNTFTEQVSANVDSILANLSAKIASSVTYTDGVIDMTPQNASTVLHIAEMFKSELLSSDFYAAIVALFFSFSELLVDHEEAYKFKESGLPSPQITDDISEMMASQTGASVAVLENHAQVVMLKLRQLLSKSIGNISMEQLIKGVNDVVRKMNDIKLVAKDQLMILFRLLGFLVYRDFEAAGYSLKFSYTGPDEKARDSCASLLNGGLKTMAEINELPSNHFHSTFVNCGGYGCRHFWLGKIAS